MYIPGEYMCSLVQTREMAGASLLDRLLQDWDDALTQAIDMGFSEDECVFSLSLHCFFVTFSSV